MTEEVIVADLLENTTPGPWHVEPVRDEDDRHIFDDDFNGNVWCVCHPQTVCDATTVVPWINEADARLIAAAPSLAARIRVLEDALRKARAAAQSYPHNPHIACGNVVRIIDAALHPATQGEE